MKYEVSAVTNTGNYRNNNEDAVLVGKTLINGTSLHKPIFFEFEGRSIIAVADGMGGHPAGHIASEVALYYLREGFYEKRMEEPYNLFSYVKEALNENIRMHPERKGMGTTLSFVIFGEGYMKMGHVGDTRIYLFDEDIRLITKDFTEAWKLYEEGSIGYDEIRGHPLRNLLTSALIADGENNIPPFVEGEFKAERGHRLLLCTDGLWELFSDNELYNIVSSYSITESADVLLKEALSRGGYDNISFIVVNIS